MARFARFHLLLSLLVSTLLLPATQSANAGEIRSRFPNSPKHDGGRITPSRFAFPELLRHHAGKPTISVGSTPSVPHKNTASTPRVAAAPAESSRAKSKIPLAPPSNSSSTTDGEESPSSADRALTTVFGSLGIVVGLFLLLVWVSRRSGSKSAGALPHDTFEVLGRAPLNNKQQMQLVRLGNKLLLLSVTANAAHTLAEVTDPDEVARLSDSCRDGRSSNLSSSFRQILAGKQVTEREHRQRPLVSS